MARLEDFLCEAFRDDELLALLREFAPDVVQALAQRGVSARQLATEAVDALRRFGYPDAELYDRLRQARPRRADEITSLQRGQGVVRDPQLPDGVPSRFTYKRELRPGTTYLVGDAKLHREVVLKVPGAPTEDARELFRAQVLRIASPLLAEVAVGVYDLSDASTPYAVFQHCAGDRITTFCEKANTYGTVVDALVSTVRALGVVHERGFVHLNLDPGNLLVEGMDPTRITIRLKDFAVHDGLGPVNPYHLPADPSPYHPPEYRAGGFIDERADLYSVGVIFSEVLDAARPRIGEHPPEALDRILARCRSADPGARPSTSEVVEALKPPPHRPPPRRGRPFDDRRPPWP